MGAAALAMLSATLRSAAPAAAGSFAAVLRSLAASMLLMLGASIPVIALCVWPLRLLQEGGGAPAMLLLGIALTLGLALLTRIWPGFALPLIWQAAAPAQAPRIATWELARRAVVFASNLSARERRVARHGSIVVGAFLLLLAVPILFETPLAHDFASWRPAALALHGFLFAPLVGWLILNRCLAILCADAGRLAAAPAPQRSAGRELEDAGNLDAALLYAARCGRPQHALALLERGADPNVSPAAADRDQRSALMLAATLPDLGLLRGLIAAGADPNRAHGGITPLVTATRDCYAGRPEAVSMLLANGADPRAADAAGETPLHHSTRCADPDIAMALLDAGADVDALNHEGLTPLGLCCRAGNWTLAAQLLGRGACAAAPRAEPAMLLAASTVEDDPTGIRLLLRYRAAPDVVNALGRTPLISAALAGHLQIAKTLLGAGADPNHVDHRGTSPLIEAARAGAVELVRLLLKRGAAVEAVDLTGRSALMIACQSRHARPELVAALLAAGADPQRVAADGRSALDHALAAGRWPLVALLDPRHPLPSSHDFTRPAPVSADALLDSLLAADWSAAAGLAWLVTALPAPALAELYLELAGPGRARARAWLLNHGLDREARLGDGRALIDALPAALPESVEAISDLAARGTPLDGAGRIAELLYAAPAGAGGSTHRQLAMRLLDAGADWCGTCAAGSHALHLAIVHADEALVVRLLQLGADPNVCDPQGRTPLHLALDADPAVRLSLVQHLLRSGGDPQAVDARGESPLGMVLARGQQDFVSRLSWTAWRLPRRRLRDADIVAAAVLGDLDAVRRLCDLGLSIDAVDGQGATALVRAAAAGHAAVVAWLLDAGADPARLTRSGMHALAAAVAAGREATLHVLLARGVSPDLPVAGGASALMVAAALGRPSLVRALIEAGASVGRGDQCGRTSLHVAAHYAFDRGEPRVAAELFELLLAQRADPNTLNGAAQSPLLILLGAHRPPGAACRGEDLRALAELLLRHGARVDLRDGRGVGVLHACAMHGLSGCARLLKARGADAGATDTFGRRPGEVAALLGYAEVAEVLDGHRASGLESLPQAPSTVAPSIAAQRPLDSASRRLQQRGGP